MSELSGILLVNKPRGISSNSVVNIVKHALGAKKTGHLGTLDVLGEGLLPVTVGKGTRLFDYYLNKDKEYITNFKFGITTDTLDLEGPITHSDNKVITLQDLQNVLQSHIGKINQMPPAYSAKKIKGQKAYDLARRGEKVELKPKLIEIYDITLLGQTEHNAFDLKVHCSSGTYIRSLCRDIASSLSTYGVMQRILRTRCGEFDLKDAFTLDEIKNGNYKLIPLDSLFEFEKTKLNDNETQRILNGVNIKIDKQDGIYKAYGKEEFLGLLEVKNGQASFYLRLI